MHVRPVRVCNRASGGQRIRCSWKSAEADIVGGGKQWAGLVYIGGTHPAAAGGAYMVLLYGFLGLRFEDGKPTLHPRLPAGWKKVQMQVHWQGKDWLLTAEEGQQA